MKLTICRHGETVENKNRIVQGQLPGQLTEKGIEQARQLAEELKNRQFDHIYSSDLARAADTTEEIIKYHPDTPVNFTEQAREISFGEFQGKKAASIDWDGLEGSLWDRQIPGGETNREMMQRAVNFVNQLLKRHEDQSVLVVCHGGVMRYVKSAIERIHVEGLFKQYVDNGEYWVFELSEFLQPYTPDSE